MHKHYVSLLFGDRGFPHPQEDWELLLPDVKDGRSICKRLHNPPELKAIDPDFGEKYKEGKHGNTVRVELKIAHLTPA